MNPARPTWSVQTKFIVTLVLLALTAFLFARFRAIVAPMVLAVILAYVLTPAVNFLGARLRIPRVVAIILTYLVLFALLALLLMLVIPPIVRQATDIGSNLESIMDQANKLLGHKFVIGDSELDGQALLTQFSGSLRTLIDPIFGSTLLVVADILSSLAWVVFIVVISIYLIKDSASLRAWLEKLPPQAYRQDYIRLRTEISNIWSSFFRGQLMLGLVVSLLISTVGLIIGLPFALLMGALAGLLEFVPSLGHGIWLTLALVLAFFRGSTWLPIPNWSFMLVILAFHIVFQQFDLNYLIPRIIGRSVRLPPLVIILGIISGAALAGVLGVVLAAPTIASLRVLGRYIYAYLVDTDPFTTEVASPLQPPGRFWWRKTSEKTHRSTE